jgi:hypothetical protein
MTHLVKEDTDDTFMGMEVEGKYGSWNRTPQEPIQNLLPYFKAAFESGITAVKWAQYTPGFNDGDPCEFTVNDPRVTTNALVAQAWLDNEDPDLEEAYPGKEYDYYDEWDYESTHDHPDGLTQATWPDVPVDSGRFEDAVRSKFGNDIEIVVTPNRVVTFEYSCGY